MTQEQLRAVLEVAILDEHDRLAEVGQALQQLLLHFLELAALDLVVTGALVEAEGEKLVRTAEILGEELVDERDVVVELADLEDLLATEVQATVPGATGGEVVALVPLLAETALVP